VAKNGKQVSQEVLLIKFGNLKIFIKKNCMVQPKYSPEEALQRVKLMMGYDSSKTLNENKSVIFEAEKVIPKKSVENQNPNIFTDADLLGDTGKIRQYFQQISDFGNVLGMPSILDIVGLNFANDLAGRRKGVKGAVDALDGFVDSKDLAYVLTLIKSLDGKCYYDDVEGKNVPAIVRFLELYKEDEGDDLSDDVNGVGTKTLPTGTDKIKQKIVKEIETQKSKSCDATVKTDGKKQQQQASSIPTELKDIEGVKKFQDWLDTNKTGWATGFPSGLLNKASGYGRFGPRTTKAWTSYGQEYLKGETATVKTVVTPGEQGVEDVNNV